MCSSECVESIFLPLSQFRKFSVKIGTKNLEQRDKSSRTKYANPKDLIENGGKNIKISKPLVTSPWPHYFLHLTSATRVHGIVHVLLVKTQQCA
jgi:hypothetical protein